MTKSLIALLSAVLILSEILLTSNPVLGFFVYALLTAGGLIAISKFDETDEEFRMIILFLILPVLRLAELFIPFENFWKSLLFYHLLGFLAVFYAVKFRVNSGFTKKNLSALPLIIILGAALGILGKFALNSDGIPKLIFILPIAAFSEEVLFRGLLQNSMEKKYSKFYSIAAVSLVYFAASLSYGLPTAAFMFLVSIALGLIYTFSRNIYLTIAANFVVQFFIFALPKA